MKHKSLCIALCSILLISGCSNNTVVNVIEEQTEQENIIEEQNDIVEEQEIDLSLTTNLDFHSDNFDIYTSNKNGKIYLTYKGSYNGVVIIQKEYGTKYKYVLNSEETQEILVTDGNGLYNITACSVHQKDVYAEPEILSEDKLQYNLVATEREIYTQSSSIVNFENNRQELHDLANKLRENEDIAEEYSYELNTIYKYFYYFTDFEYDNDLANDIENGSVIRHDVDIHETLSKKKGICLDTATAFAAILRNEGYPTKLVYGYTREKGQYHSWVQVFVDYKWITFDPVGYKLGSVQDVSNYNIREIH